MSAPGRALAILQLFEGGTSVWTVEDIARALHASTSTTYRHVRLLVQSGFLDPTHWGGYRLGPAFIRYDRISRQSDELIQHASPLMKKLLKDTTQSATVILCRRFRECVMCVHEEHGQKPHAPTSYERGVAMPMFLGATSKVILAHLPERNLRATYLNYEREIRRAGLKDWSTFKDQMRLIRRAGTAMTESEITQGRVGIAAPIFRGGLVTAGLSLVFVPTASDRRKFEIFASKIKGAARQLSDLISLP